MNRPDQPDDIGDLPLIVCHHCPVSKSPEADTDSRNVVGTTLGETFLDASAFNTDVIRLRSNPVCAQGSLAVLKGNLCPDGAVIKPAAAEEKLLQHRGPAVVFRNYPDLKARINDPALKLTP
ncbi:MAG: dihydroxy-acid dehydratase, partial [Phycisphaerae bacterium]